MAAAFEPKFVDLVRNFTTTSGTGSFVLGNAVAGFSSIATALTVGDRFYYSVVSVSQPNETEVGRGTLLSNGMVAREPAKGVATNFGIGVKTITLVAAADWFSQVNAIAGGILFTQIASRRFLKSIDSFHTSGRSQVGQYGGRYVRDADQSQYTSVGQALIAGGKLTSAQVTAILSRVRAQDADGVYWTLAEPVVEVGHFGAVGDGIIDDTAAVQAAIDKAHHWHGGGTIRIGSGEWALSSIQVRANVNVQTAGAATRLKQIPGQPMGTRLVTIVGSNVTIGDIAVEGNIATDINEQNHGIFVQANSAVGDLVNIALGNIKGRNIRGDLLYVGTGSSGGKKVLNISWGDVVYDNVYRNAISIVGAVDGWRGGSLVKDPAATYGCGFLDFDLESNVGGGMSIGGRMHSIRGKRAMVVETTAADSSIGIEFGTIDLDPSRDPGSNPNYPVSGTLVSDHGFQLRNSAYCKIGAFIANGFNGQAIKQVYSGGEMPTQVLEIGYCKITDSCKTETTYSAYIQGASGVTVLKIGYLDAATTLSTHRVILSCDKAQIGLAKVALAPTSSFIASSNDAKIGNLTMTAQSGNGGIAVNGCQRCEINGGTIAGDRLFSFATNCVARNLTATLVTGALVSDTNSHFFNSTVNSIFYGDSFYREDSGANIASVASGINTVGKYKGKLVWDLTNARMMRASGSTAASTWQSIGGGTTVTPA